MLYMCIYIYVDIYNIYIYIYNNPKELYSQSAQCYMQSYIHLYILKI